MQIIYLLFGTELSEMIVYRDFPDIRAASADGGEGRGGQDR